MTLKVKTLFGNPILETIPEKTKKNPSQCPVLVYLDREEGSRCAANADHYATVVKEVEVPIKRIFDDYYDYFHMQAFEKLAELFDITPKK